MPEVSEEDEIGEESLFSARSPSDGAQAHVEHCNGYGNVISHPNEQFWKSKTFCGMPLHRLSRFDLWKAST